MYSSKLGRFSACDPIFVGKNHIANPQRWNLYVYVLNNPLAKFDPDGKNPKQKIIDVYIVFGGGATVSDLEKKEYLETLEKGIKSAIKDKNVKVTVRGWEQSTADNIAQSLRTKGASVIIAAHIGGVNAEKGGLNEVGKPRTGANAIALKDGLIKGGGIETYSQDGKPYLVKESIKADSLYLFSCQIHPDTATQIAKRMGAGGSLTYLDAGRDGETEIMSDVKSAVITAINEGNNESRSVINASIKTIFDADKGKGANKGDEKPITCDNKGVCKSY